MNPHPHSLQPSPRSLFALIAVLVLGLATAGAAPALEADATTETTPADSFEATVYDPPITDLVPTRPTRTWLDADGSTLPFESDDAAIEFLHSAEIVARKQLDTGINRPLKVTLERDGIRAHAVFRTVESVVNGDRSNRPDRYRSYDRYHHEVAAYHLSRVLGFHRVPPVVMRSIDGRRGSLQLWIEDAVTEAKLVTSERAALHPARRQIQKQMMMLFDQLIYNFDRHQANSLYDRWGRLWYIDHTRSFRSLPQLKNAGGITVCDREIFERLRDADPAALREQLSPYLNAMQVDAVLRRQRMIVDRLEGLIEERGEPSVLFDLEARTTGKPTFTAEQQPSGDDSTLRYPVLSELPKSPRVEVSI